TSGKDTAAPTPQAISSRPTRASSRSKRSLSAGSRETQVAYWKPRKQNSAAVASRPRRKPAGAGEADSDGGAGGDADISAPQSRAAGPPEVRPGSGQYM